MRTTRIARIAGSAVAVTALALTAGCGGGDSGGGGGEGGGEASTLQDAIDAGTITVGFAGEVPVQLRGGRRTHRSHRRTAPGDLLQLGIDEVEGVNADFGALIPGLTADRFDAVSAGMSILPERCEQAAFSNPEFMYTTALMTPEGNPEDLATMDDLVDTDLNVATMTGAIESDYATSLGLSNHSEVSTPQDGMDAVSTGRADVFALTGISLNSMADNNPRTPASR